MGPLSVISAWRNALAVEMFGGGKIYRGEMYLGTIYLGKMYQAVKPDSKGNLVAVEERLKHFRDFNALITNLF